MSFAIEEWQQCPPGLQWYVCHQMFRGCCTVDPCMQLNITCPNLTSDFPTPTSGTSFLASQDITQIVVSHLSGLQRAHGHENMSAAHIVP